jgi:2-polyprenyl-3-methyl-5-hydroxy-6-metoxy-1,4-benzoquinol methylase
MRKAMVQQALKVDGEIATHPVAQYYHFVRTQIAPLLPENPKKILEVGCASGATLRWLKSIFPDAQTTGVELNSALLPELRQNADIGIIGTIEDCIPRLDRYDLILALDVLEHLTDSLGTLRRLCDNLEGPGSRVIVSLPNVAHLSVSAPLLFRRRFEYQDAGILDRTHMRFFTEASAVELLNKAGLIVTGGVISGLQGPKSRLIDRLSFGLLRHHLAKQYIMCGCPITDGLSSQPRIRWGVAS